MWKPRLLTPTTRDVLCVELVEALHGATCAFCHLAERKSQRYVTTLLDETVADVDHRDAWRAAKGLCYSHAQIALRTPHSAGSLALLYDDLLRHEQARLTVLTSPTPRRWPWQRPLLHRFRQWAQAWRQRPTCQVCLLWQEHEQLYRAVLLDTWDAPEVSRAFAASSGLCWPHLLGIVECHNTHPHLPALLTAQLTCLHTLQGDLQEFIRKLDYRFAREPYGREADAWQRVVQLYIGRMPTSP